MGFVIVMVTLHFASGTVPSADVNSAPYATLEECEADLMQSLRLPYKAAKRNFTGQLVVGSSDGRYYEMCVETGR